MANVKFYRLGSTGGVSLNVYNESKIQDGRIIFAQVKDSSNEEELHQYIWANGIEYAIPNNAKFEELYSDFQTLIDDTSIGGIYTNENSVHYWIQNAIQNIDLTAENFMKIVDSSSSNVSIGIKDSSLVFEVDDAATTDSVVTAQNVGYITKGMTIPEGTTLQELVNMIFTKILGLSGSTEPSLTISGISGGTKEVGEVLTNLTASVTYKDGSWKNEESWQKNGIGPNQPYGTSALTYSFNGLDISVGPQSGNSVSIPSYQIIKGSQSLNVTVTNTNSVNVPVNQALQQLEVGTSNTTTTYKPYVAPIAGISKPSSVYVGDYKYWIGYTDKVAEELTRNDIGNQSSGKQSYGWAGNSVSYATLFNSPTQTYVTFVVPKGLTLKTVEDSFGNDVVANFVRTDVTGLGLIQSDEFTVYQEWAEAGAGLDRKNITLN